MSNALNRICADKREDVAARKARVAQGVVEQRAAAAPPPRGFLAALEARLAGGSYGLIAEIKKASPSEGLIRPDFDPAGLARAYAAGGAACLSVLTDGPYFQGCDEDLVAARAAVGLPVLRKDFMLDPYQVAEARALGADCILLILAALDDAAARDLEQAAQGYAMDVLAEVHTTAELDRALRLDTRLIGINNRDLKTLRTDLATTEALAPKVPPERILVGESGLATRADLDRLSGAGVNCFLIGTSLMRRPDVAKATRSLTGGAAGRADERWRA